jgi:hypothetical protein
LFQEQEDDDSMEAQANASSESGGKRTLIFGGIALVLLGVAAYVFLAPKEEGPPEVLQAKGIYYTGPMKSKKAGSKDYGSIDGRKLTEEEARAEEKKWLDAHPGIANPGKN